MAEIVELPAFPPAQPLEQPLLRNTLMSPRINGAMEIRDGTIFAKQLVVGSQTWIHDLVFTPSDYRTMAWTSGTIQLADGTSYAISSGNTGAIAATTYVYFDKTATLQVTTTYSSSISDDKILLAIVEPVLSNTSALALITAFNAQGTTIDGDKIVTGKIQSSDGKTYFDLDNKYLVVNDGTYDRVLLGYQSGGF